MLRRLTKSKELPSNRIVVQVLGLEVLGMGDIGISTVPEQCAGDQERPCVLYFFPSAGPGGWVNPKP